MVLEAVATEGERVGLGIEPGALDDLADELASHYAVVSERPGAYETELWVEEGTAGGAVLAAQFLWQAAVRYLGLPAWEVVRAEARDAHALEIGIIDWPSPPAGPDDQEPDELPPPDPASLGPAIVRSAAPKPATKKPATKNTATKKAASKKAATKKAATKNTATKKAATKKAVPKRGMVQKSGARKARSTRP